jgi:hypothetical protein
MVSHSTTSQFSFMPLKKSTNQCNKISQISGIYLCSNPRSNLIFLLISQPPNVILSRQYCLLFFFGRNMGKLYHHCQRSFRLFIYFPHLGCFSFFSPHQPNVSNLIIIFLKHLIYTNDLFSLILAHEVCDLFRTLLHHKLI